VCPKDFAGAVQDSRAADLEIGDTADLEVCATMEKTGLPGDYKKSFAREAGACLYEDAGGEEKGFGRLYI
jgi:hypothetical protein